MGLIATVREALDPTSFNHPHGDEWRKAVTFGDLCDLTARWLDGDLAWHPTYNCTPEEETDEIAGPLARLNRAGFLTTQSQPAYGPAEWNGRWWDQRAAVVGFAHPDSDTLAQLHRACAGTELRVISHNPASRRRWRLGQPRGMAVTRADTTRVTGFGHFDPPRHVRWEWTVCDAVDVDLVDLLCTCTQVTVVDPMWGRKDLLWNTLGRFAGSA